MREVFLKLFEQSHFNTGISITPFSLSHIVYLILIFGSIFGGALLLKNKSMETKEKVLRFLAYALVISYVSDFFVHDFVYDHVNMDLNMDKLPFHICTVLCPIIAFTQFNKHFQRFIEPITILAVVAPMMYICYPASVGSGEPWCYQAVQTMFFHGVELAWGILNIATGKVKPNIKNSWKAAVVLIGITLWAKLGNEIYGGHNWFFLEEDAFYIGLVGNGIIPKWTLMIFTPAAIFLMVLIIYGIYYGVIALWKKYSKKESA